MVSENLEQVKANIEAACKRVGRDPKDVRLVAVSKTKPISLIEEAIEAGQDTFGENKVQEMCSRQYKMAYDWSSAAKQGKIYRRKG